MNIRVKITRTGSPDKGKVITLDVEEYLRGVVPSEIPASSPHEALCAQAVAARTYAVDKIRKNAKGPCDVDDTTANQAYKQGFSNPRTDQAIRDTAGQVLHHGGKIVDTAVYCASNGGRIKSSKEHGWNHRDYLIAKDDPYDKRAGYAKDGHGVGMSQRGAQQMGKEGCCYVEILAFYYPGTVVVCEGGATPTPESPKGDEAVYYAVCNGSAVYIRVGRGTQHTALGKLNKGDKMIALPAVGGWCEVAAQVGGKLVAGYVSAEYVKAAGV